MKAVMHLQEITHKNVHQKDNHPITGFYQQQFRNNQNQKSEPSP
jgi:hypothetical protein